ncbi:melanopsin-B-like [Actinia tenebrosa]|uniref:Melanopsin-B-like n=1 Tax=Actinia tenebrosa TaxID=6105 RepID=A0A6P8IHF3_ACTTE|nr:melanopsin-B-like [Actinia tenebrosa]
MNQSTSRSNDYQLEQLHYKLEQRSSEQMILEPFFAALIMVLAVFGNSLVILTFYKNKNLLTIPNFFVLNLLITDLLMALTILPVFVLTLGRGKWMFDDTVCTVQGFWNFTLFSVTLFTLTAISINRFIRIVYPAHYSVIYIWKNVYAIIAGIWFFCLLSSTSPLWGLGRYAFNPNTALCTTGGGNEIFRFISHVVMLIIMLIIAICNFRIVKAVRSHSNNISRNKSRTNGCIVQERRGEEIHISKSISIVVGVFSFCWIPTYVMDSLEAHDIMVPRVARLLGIFTILMDSVLNPFVFGLTNKKLRLAIRETFRETFVTRIQRHRYVFPSRPELRPNVINVSPINVISA